MLRLSYTIGILGGGQLGRMLAFAARRLGMKIFILDPDPQCPSHSVVHKHVVGDFKKPESIREFSKGCDVLTVEIEHVDADMLAILQNEGLNIQPSPMTIKIIQDKFRQKEHLSAKGVRVAPFLNTPTVESVLSAAETFKYPMVLKSKFGAYDGRGNAVVRSAADVPSAFAKLGGQNLYVEQWIPFTKELAVNVARALDGRIVSHPVVETIQKENICHTVIAPAQISSVAYRNAMELAERAVATFEGAGIYGVEMFLCADDSVLLNEIAPRVHNSGHYTIEGCAVSQFEQHIRAIAGLPLASAELIVGAAGMINILGTGENELEKTLEPINRALGVSGASIHWYEKTAVKAQRKMGHITVVAPNFEELRKRMDTIGVNQAISSSPTPLVGIIMGSDSDLPKMKAAAETLKEFGVAFEVDIVSAHRTPERMFHYATTAHTRGIKVIIAGAGGAAHLPGMTASMTPLPVIGVPVRIEPLNGEDSMLSILQMPRGIPVATVAINNSANAGLLAVRMLAAHDPSLLQKMVSYQQKLKEVVEKKSQKLQREGWEHYKPE